MNDPQAQSESNHDQASDASDKGGMFTAMEARILACLMEKELAVPDSYPLTMNSLLLGCNQKSNREPQMQLAEGAVGHAARALADRHFIKIEYGERAQKFEHKMRLEFDLDKQQQALLCVLMLRAPQTLNELKTRTARMVQFENLTDIQLTLDAMNERDKPLVQHFPKGAGQREDRYGHLLCGEVASQAIAPVKELATPRAASSSGEVEAMHAKIAELEERIARLEELIV